METTTATISTTNYAGFGQRLVACIIDGIIISIAYSIIVTPILAAVGIGIAAEAQNMEGMSEDEVSGAAIGMIGTLMATMGTIFIVIYAIQIIYYTLMESSKLQGSVGKMVMNVKVVDMDGNRISVSKAFVRSLGKLVSQTILYIGYLMAAFTEKKQGLHDIMAGTLVVKK